MNAPTEAELKAKIAELLPKIPDWLALDIQAKLKASIERGDNAYDALHLALTRITMYQMLACSK